MLGSLFGMTVAREVPAIAMAGLATGQYTLHGGVIRWASGTAQAGQIVCHLLPAAGLLGPAALLGAGIIPAVMSGITMVNSFRILKHTKQIIALSEMNLAATQAGFYAIERRLNQLEQKLDEVKTAVEQIQKLLLMEQRAELWAALDSLSHADLLSDPDVRNKTLVGAAVTLAKIGMMYEERIKDAKNLREAMACEEYFCITVLAQARCYAELREPARALSIMTAFEQRWYAAAQSITKRFILNRDTEKLLYSDFAKETSTAEIIVWLDFMHDTDKGLTWIDTLRQEIEPWYYTRLPEQNSSARKFANRIGIDEVLYMFGNLVFPAMRKLVARRDVLSNYIGQFEIMKNQRLTPQEFEAQLQNIGEEQIVDDFIILTAPSLLAQTPA